MSSKVAPEPAAEIKWIDSKLAAQDEGRVPNKKRGVSASFLMKFLTSKLKTLKPQRSSVDFHSLMKSDGGILDLTHDVDGGVSLWSKVPEEEKGEPELFISHTWVVYDDA